MTESRAVEIINRHEKMVSARSTWESHWREIGERVLPRQNTFNIKRQGGEKLTDKIFDSTAQLALERFAAAVESMNTPRTQMWHSLSAHDPELKDDDEVKEYLEEITKRLFNARYLPRANYASQTSEVYMSLGAFGTGMMFVDEIIGRGLFYKSLPLANVYFLEDHTGFPATVPYVEELTARPAIQKWGDKTPAKVKDKAEKSPETTYKFIHVVMPRKDIDVSRKDFRGMPYASFHVFMDDKQIIDEGGYTTQPYCIARYVTAPNETYGRSPAMTVLADIKQVNEMSKTILRSAQKQVDPPLLLSDDGVLSSFSTRPNALNYGAVNSSGQALAQPLALNGRLDIGLEMQEQRRKTINDAFLVTLFQILVETPQMTATEALLRAQEKGALLAPTMGRIQSELLGPQIERELDLLSKAEQLPPMPNKLLRKGGLVKIDYQSPIARLQRSDEAVGIMRTLEAVTPLAQIDPTILDRFNKDEIVKILADINGAPAKALLNDEELASLKEQRTQQAQAAALMEAAPVATQSLKDLAETQQIANQSPQVTGVI